MAATARDKILRAMTRKYLLGTLDRSMASAMSAIVSTANTIAPMMSVRSAAIYSLSSHKPSQALVCNKNISNKDKRIFIVQSVST